MSSSDDCKIEFSVNLTCKNCVDKTRSVLSKAPGVSDFSVDLEKQKVVVVSSKPTADIQSLLESTGKRAVVVGVGSASDDTLSNQKPGPAAVATIGGVMGIGTKGVQGVVRFAQVSATHCLIDGTVDGLAPNEEHGLAIHVSGNLSGGCETLGEHFNPRGTRHGSPEDGENERHVGDLGNIKANELGRATFRFSDKLVKVSDIIGRSLVVAEGKDDFGQGGQPDSLVNGNCGKPLACGIIARSSGLFQNEKKFCACDGVTIWDERNKPVAGKDRSTTSNL